jgi:uncharacterized protein YqjF (DUF2071 family)
MSVFLSAQWRHLAMVSWPVERAALEPLVPLGTELDEHDGRTYVSLVGFRFLDTRLLGLAVPFHRDFDEVNLRFYLRRRTADGTQRGVAFIRELVPHRAIAWTARLCYNEPYRALPMASRIESDAVDYRWRLSRWNALRLVASGAWGLPDPASRDGWIAEHYWGWTRQRDGGTVAYRVEHPPWRIRPATDVAIDADLAETYGPMWAGLLTGAPASAFVAEGSAVTVGTPKRL